MRHLKAGSNLGVKPDHKRAMMRNMVTSILEKGRITTTVARAKAVRRPLDKMITLGKRGDLHARRQALSFVKSKAAMSALFGDLAERYKDRPGGYSRIIKAGFRHGDGAPLAIVQLVGAENDPFPAEAKPARKGRGKGKAAKGKAAPKGGAARAGKAEDTVLDDVAEEVSAKDAEAASKPKRGRKKKSEEAGEET